MPLATALRSMVEVNQSPHPLHVTILTSQFSARFRQKIVASVPNGSMLFRWQPVDLGGFVACSTRPYISKATYTRLLLADLVDHSVERVLYVDADVLVLHDLNGLWNTDLEGCAIGAVIDTDSADHSSRLWHDAFRSGTMQSAPQYFNAGVLLVDLVRWREDQITYKALRYMRENPDTPLADQDALNFACTGHWKMLHPQWNCQIHPACGYAALPPAQRPSIVHFAGKWKPWDARTLSADAGFFDTVRSRTCFPRSIGERCVDAVQANWHRLRRHARRSQYVRAAYNYFFRRKASM